MARQVSGTFRRTDRVRAADGTSVRLVFDERTRDCRATLLELSLADVLLSEANLPALGTAVSVAITLSGRYLEFELPGLVTWHHGDEFGVSFEYLTARQTYGLALAIDVLGSAQEADLSPEKSRLSSSQRGNR